jgi:hypothetical protein
MNVHQELVRVRSEIQYKGQRAEQLSDEEILAYVQAIIRENEILLMLPKGGV